MSSRSRYEYVRSIHQRYLRCGRREKTRMLDEFCSATGLNRKYSIYVLNNFVVRRSNEWRGRPRKYGRELYEPLKQICTAAGFRCAELLHPRIPSLLPLLEKHGYVNLDSRVRHLLLSMSCSTLKRLLPSCTPRDGKRPRQSRGQTHLMSQIPLQCSVQRPATPGYLELDLVEHNGVAVMVPVFIPSTLLILSPAGMRSMLF
jgi:hypothetical protein